MDLEAGFGKHQRLGANRDLQFVEQRLQVSMAVIVLQCDFATVDLGNQFRHGVINFRSLVIDWAFFK